MKVNSANSAQFWGSSSQSKGTKTVLHKVVCIVRYLKRHELGISGLELLLNISVNEGSKKAAFQSGGRWRNFFILAAKLEELSLIWRRHNRGKSSRYYLTGKGRLMVRECEEYVCSLLAENIR